MDVFFSHGGTALPLTERPLAKGHTTGSSDVATPGIIHYTFGAGTSSNGCGDKQGEGGKKSLDGNHCAGNKYSTACDVVKVLCMCCVKRAILRFEGSVEDSSSGLQTEQNGIRGPLYKLVLA